MTPTLYPPSPKGKPWRHLLAYFRDPLGFLMRMVRDYGDIVHFMFGSQHFYLINHPDYIQDVLETHHRNFIKRRGLKPLLGNGLLTSEGEFHRRQRRRIQPAFHPQRFARYGAVMTDYASRMRDGWKDGATLDIAQEMRQLTLAIACKTFFGVDMESEMAVSGELINAVMEFYSPATKAIPRLLARFPLFSRHRVAKARTRLDAVIHRMIHKRRSSELHGDDLLSTLLHLQKADDDGGELSDSQLRDEVATLIFAGHETTANALTWTWYLLSQHPEVEARLHAELDSALSGRLPTLDDLQHLRYTEMVLAEALRLYPPVWVVVRQAINDSEMGGYLMPAKSLVYMSQYVMHRDSRYFPDPSLFDPQRWTPEVTAERPRFSYFPFAAGPRGCIGERFSWVEGVLLIATLAQQWRLRLVPGHPVELQPRITLRPKHGMRMMMGRRRPVLVAQGIG